METKCVDIGIDIQTQGTSIRSISAARQASNACPNQCQTGNPNIGTIQAIAAISYPRRTLDSTLLRASLEFLGRIVHSLSLSAHLADGSGTASSKLESRCLLPHRGIDTTDRSALGYRWCSAPAGSAAASICIV